MPAGADRGWSVVFTPAAECVHVGGASHGGRLFRENVKGHLRYLSLHEGHGAARAGSATHAHGPQDEGRGVTAGSAGGTTATPAEWLGSGDVDSLLAG